MPATPWLWAYWPVMKVARAGQQSGNESIGVGEGRALRGEQPPDVRHVRDVGVGLVVGHHDEDVRAAVLAPPWPGAPAPPRQARRDAATRAPEDLTRASLAYRSSPRRRAGASVHRVSHSVNFCMLGAACRQHPAPHAHRLRRAPEPPESRERIVAAATELVRRRAYAELSVDEVMREAGLGRTIFYRHFDDLADLLLRAEPRGDRGALRGPAQPGSARPTGSGRGAPRDRGGGGGLPAPRAAAARVAEAAAGDEQIARDYAAMREPLRRPRRGVPARRWPTSARRRSPTSPRPRGRST